MPISVQQVGSDTTFSKADQSNMTSFYMTLPSNSSMNYYPENTVTKYKTHLAQPISLEGDWEVGLFEFEYHRTWYNVEEKDSKIKFDHMKNDKVVREKISIPYGYYTTIEELTDRIKYQLYSFRSGEWNNADAATSSG